MKTEILDLTDNNYNNEFIICNNSKHCQTLLDIANINLKNESSLLLFPLSFEETELYNNKEQNLSIISLLPASPNEYKIQTNNIMGFIGKKDLNISIHSRFDYTDNKDTKKNKDYLLYYMLSKVMNLNVFNLDTQNDNKDNILDFYMMLFPQALKEAIQQGLYKEYRTINYNDDRIKGSIDVSRFIKEDIPFQGKVSYRTREYSHDNHLLQLIRHTIEYMHTHPLGHQLLNNDFDTRSAILQIINSTASYTQRDRLNIIQCNQRHIVSHPYYTKYRPLQKICLSILTHQGLKYGKDDDKIHGILFDGAWLWEEYLNTLLKYEGFKHPDNKKGREGIALFKHTPKHTIYPDFFKEGVVADAKYKRYAKGIDDNKREVSRDDLYQIITYMHRLNVHKGVFICPCTNEDTFATPYEIDCTDDTIHVLGLNIPQHTEEMSFRNFCLKMEQNENDFISKNKDLFNEMHA